MVLIKLAIKIMNYGNYKH